MYRFGQTKPCYIYRFVAMGTMEEKIYERQVTKLATSKRVVDEHQIDRHYTQNDLYELYRTNLEPGEERPPPALPKDRLLAELLRTHPREIWQFHEHDSLLENKVEENLSTEEVDAAWREYEHERAAQTARAHMASQMLSAPDFNMSSAAIPSNILPQLLRIKILNDFPESNEKQIVSMIASLKKRLQAESEVNDRTVKALDKMNYKPTMKRFFCSFITSCWPATKFVRVNWL